MHYFAEKNFVVNTQLELQFEFRTSEQNGILLSITDPFNNHGLSLELYNGAVVMMGNMGSNGPTKVKTNLSTEYSLCDNKWHKVSALFSKEEMTVNVDGVVISSLAINSLFMESKIESALYIGGLPGTFLIKYSRSLKTLLNSIKKRRFVFSQKPHQNSYVEPTTI